MPRVFISWSGEKSKAIAETLNNWLPVVLQSVKPFLSVEDLRKGGRWLTELSEQLQKESFGIICLTPTNLLAPWILFEAGALSKSVGDSQVAPFLVGVKPSELPSPLTQFNAVLANRDDFGRMIKALNERVPQEAVSPDTIDKALMACWPSIIAELDAAKEEVPPVETDIGGSKDQLERLDVILQELLLLNRSQSKMLSSPETLLPIEYLIQVNNTASKRIADTPEVLSLDHPVWKDLANTIEEVRRSPWPESSEDVARTINLCDYILGRLGVTSPTRNSLIAKRLRQIRERSVPSVNDVEDLPSTPTRGMEP